jgi:hypothetical protein
MKDFVTFLAIAGIVAALTLGGGFVFAKGTSGEMTTCDVKFMEMDSGNKGYITYDEFRAEYDGVGIRNSRPAGLSPAGNYYSVFTSLNSSKDGMLTMEQFCGVEKGRY